MVYYAWKLYHRIHFNKIFNIVQIIFTQFYFSPWGKPQVWTISIHDEKAKKVALIWLINLGCPFDLKNWSLNKLKEWIIGFLKNITKKQRVSVTFIFSLTSSLFSPSLSMTELLKALKCPWLPQKFPTPCFTLPLSSPLTLTIYINKKPNK